MEPPYIEVLYETTERQNSVEVDIRYVQVQIVRTERTSIYSTGNYAFDVSRAQLDGRVVDKIQNHPSIATYERLAATAPNERYKFLTGADTKFRSL